MNHSFNVDIAKQVGVHAAILLENIAFWVLHHHANNTYCHDGKTWTYNSKKAFSELFPYMTERQVEYALNKLKDANLILVGNYNKAGFDQTKWYTLTDTAIQQFCGMEGTKLLNANNKIVEPIPIINTVITSNINSRKQTYAEKILMTEEEYQKLIDLAKDKRYVDDVIDSASYWKLDPRNKSKAGKIRSDYLFVRNWLKREIEKNPPAPKGIDYETIWLEVLDRIKKPWSPEGWSSLKLLNAVRKVGFSRLQQCSSYDLEKMKRALIEAYKEG